jgi:hypothetical protein
MHKSFSFSIRFCLCNGWKIQTKSQQQRIKTAKETAQTYADNQRRSNMATRR